LALYGVLLSLLVGVVRGGKLGGLAEVPLRMVPAIFLAFGLQLVMHIPLTANLPGMARWAGALHMSSYLVLFMAFLANWRLPGMTLMGLGAALNFTVIAANGMRMPVSETALHAAGLKHLAEALAADTVLTHQLLTSQTRLSFLADIFALPPPFPRPCAFSAGDVALVAGVFIFVQAAMMRHRRDKG